MMFPTEMLVFPVEIVCISTGNVAFPGPIEMPSAHPPPIKGGG